MHQQSEIPQKTIVIPYIFAMLDFRSGPVWAAFQPASKLCLYDAWSALQHATTTPRCVHCDLASQIFCFWKRTTLIQSCNWQSDDLELFRARWSRSPFWSFGKLRATLSLVIACSTGAFTKLLCNWFLSEISNWFSRDTVRVLCWDNYHFLNHHFLNCHIS